MATDTITSISAASADETIGTALPFTSFDRVGWTVVSGAGVSAGVVTIEWAHTSDYSGTWAVLATVTTSAASTVYGDSADAVAGFLRARISTAITGGTITAYLSRSINEL